MLATYNGAPWIGEQLSSILLQSNVDLEIFISDDGSSDNTLAVCRALADIDQRIKILPDIGRIGGVAKNFFRLLSEVNISKYQFIALSDQDDIWNSNKIEVGIQKIRLNKCAAYSSDVEAFWPDGQKRIIKKSQNQCRLDYFFEAAGPGCTYLFKKDVLLIFQKFIANNWDFVSQISLHDWMLYAWYRDNGYKWYIDDYPGVLYRQHQFNEIGVNSGLKAFFKRLKKIKKGWYRGEVGKMLNLVQSSSSNSHLLTSPDGSLSLLRVIKNINSVRRRKVDRFYLLMFIVFGIF